MEAAARRLAPAVGEVLAALAGASGARLVRMSGSGATCFGLFGSCREAARAASALRQAHPEWWVKATVLR
jgi:4-diphosphocytidyl-2-C-methyl-D-erythritol kinase